MMRKLDLIAGGLALTLVTVSGCSSGQSRLAQRADNTRYMQGLDGQSAASRLTLLAEREASKASEPERGIVNQIMEGRLVELRDGSAEYRRAHESVDEVLGDVLDGIDEVEGDEIPLLPQIAKGYVRARAMMMSGDADGVGGAVAIFEQIQEASPKSPEILIGLGDAHMKAGNRAEGARAYLRAIELGDRTVRALVYGAMGSTDDPERVIELGTLVWTMEDSSDRAGRLLGGVMLGQALIESGWYAAGAEVMSEALTLLDGQTARDPKYRRELVQLYTKRAEQYASLGDAWMLLDEPGRAMGLYELAGSMVSNEPQELMARMVAADFLAGHSALGAMGLLEWIDGNPGNDSAGFLKLIGIVGEHSLIGGVGGMLFESLDERAHDLDRAASHRRAILGMMLRIAESPDAGVATLGGAEAGIVSPVACMEVLSRFEGREAKLGAAMGMIERSASIGFVMVPALIRLDGSPLELLELVEGEEGGSETAGLVRCLIALDLQRPDLYRGDDSGSGLVGNRSTAWLIAHARLASLGARWDDAGRLFEACGTRQASMNAAERFFYVDSLVTANRADDAMGMVELWASQDGAAAVDWLLHARTAQKVGMGESVLDSLTKAIDLDPYDEAIYEQLITLWGSGGTQGDIDELRTVSRSLVQRLPGSALVGLIRGHELAAAGEGMIARSERVLLEAHANHPWREIGIDLLLSIWATQHKQGDETALRRGMGWVEGQLGMMPGSVELSSGMARLMVLSGDSIGAEGYLDGLFERIPSRGVGRLHEGLIRSVDARRDEGDALALERLDGLVSVGDCLERLERAGGAGRLGEFGADELVPVDGSWKLGLGQSLRIVRVLGALAQAGGDGADTDLLLELVERTRMQSVQTPVIEGIDPLESLDLIELVVLPVGSGFSMDRYEELLRTKLGSDNGEELVTVAVQALMRSRTPGDALDLFTRLSVDNDGGFDAKRAGDLGSLLGQIGTVEDLETAVAWFEGRGLVVEARDAVVGTLGTLREGSMAEAGDHDGVMADLVYSVAVVASFYGRDEVAMGMYRVALSHDGGHAWASNDLGYKMVEDGGDLVEAERLLLVAHEAEPGAASITDSLAWAMYGLGVMDDEIGGVDGAGTVVRRGAVGLLREALTQDDGTANATIYDHLGDALWMSGVFEEALGAWLDAEGVLRERLTELSNEENLNSTAIVRLREELSAIRFKIADGESGRVPSVAPNSVGLAVPMPETDGNDIVEEIDPGLINPEK